MASEIEQVTSLGENGGGEDSTLMEQAAIERRNLLNIVKLTVKVLIESAMRKGQPMDDSNSNLQQLFTAIEHSLRHRLKGKLTTERKAMHTQTYHHKCLLGLKSPHSCRQWRNCAQASRDNSIVFIIQKIFF